MKAPYNYTKPSMVQYIVDWVADAASDDWEEVEIGEMLANEFELADKSFEFTNKEYMKLIDVLDKFVKDELKAEIQEGVDKYKDEHAGDYADYHDSINEAVNN